MIFVSLKVFFATALLLTAMSCHTKRPTLKQIDSAVIAVTMRSNSLAHDTGDPNPYSFSAWYQPRRLQEPYATVVQMEELLGEAESKADTSADQFKLSWRAMEGDGGLEAFFDRRDNTIQRLEFETPNGPMGQSGRETVGRSVEWWRWEQHASRR